MQIFTRCPSGLKVQDVTSSMTVFELKQMISEQEAIDSDFFSLSHCGSTLDESSSLESCGVIDQSNIEFLMSLDGGKRKKKVYTTPKKTHHKHKSIKMMTMSFYKIEGENVKPLKRVCPDESCGEGVFMAKHFDRHYCGRCRLVFKIADAPKKDPKGKGGALKRSVIEAQLRQKKEAAAAAKKEKK